MLEGLLDSQGKPMKEGFYLLKGEVCYVYSTGKVELQDNMVAVIGNGGTFGNGVFASRDLTHLQDPISYAENLNRSAAFIAERLDILEAEKQTKGNCSAEWTPMRRN